MLVSALLSSMSELVNVLVLAILSSMSEVVNVLVILSSLSELVKGRCLLTF